MNPCFYGSCNRNNSATTTNNTTLNEEESKMFFNVFLPVIIVISAFVAIGLGLLSHRLILKMLRKRWASEATDGSNGGIEGGCYTRRGINTISQSVSDLPTYVQVIKTIEKEGNPPSYYETVNGVTNFSFSADQELPENGNIGEREVVDGGIGSSLAESSQTPQANNLSERNSSPLDSCGSYAYRNGLPPSGCRKNEPTLDDVINSISVPSILFEDETSNSNCVRTTKTVSSSGRSKVKPLNSKATSSQNNGRSRSLFLRNTPL